MRLDEAAVPITLTLPKGVTNLATMVAARSGAAIDFAEAALRLRPSYQGLRGDSTPQGGFVEVRRNGLIWVGQELWPRSSTNGKGIDLEVLHRVVPTLLWFASASIQLVQYHGFAMLVLTISPTTGTALTSANVYRNLWGENKIAEDRLTFSLQVLTDDLLDRHAELSEMFIVRIMQAYGLAIYEWKDAELQQTIGALTGATKAITGSSTTTPR